MFATVEKPIENDPEEIQIGKLHLFTSRIHWTADRRVELVPINRDRCRGFLLVGWNIRRYWDIGMTIVGICFLTSTSLRLWSGFFV